MPTFSRIEPLMNVKQLQNSTVTVIGNGGGASLTRNLARCGVRRFKLVDFDRIELANICRQEHFHDGLGMLKVDALAHELWRINPEANITTYPRNLLSFSDNEIDAFFGDTDAFVFAVDNLDGNARGNQIALRLGIAAVFSGVYPAGLGGEVVFWHRELLPCYRCLCPARYKAFEEEPQRPANLPSADILAVHHIDSITGMVVIGLLTRGSDNQYGRLIDQLGDRNFLHVKVFPEWRWNGRDVIREQLQIPPECDTFLGWCTAARRDPDRGQLPCRDCEQFRGHTFTTIDGKPVRLLRGQTTVASPSPLAGIVPPFVP